MVQADTHPVSPLPTFSTMQITRTRSLLLLVLLAQAPSSNAADRPLLDTLVLGAAQGLILAVAGVLYFFWRSYKTRRLTERIAKDLPDLVLNAADGDDAKVAALLDSGSDPNVAGPAGQTALMLAARNGHATTVALLLERGADPSRKTRTGSTAHEIAKTYKQSACESLLASAGMPK